MTIWPPKSAVLATLSISVLLIVGCEGDPPTSSGPPVEPEVFSYAAIAGEWEGVVRAGGFDFLVEATITRDSALRGQLVGSIVEMAPQTRDTITHGELRAKESDPPVYLMDWTAIHEGGGDGGTERWVYDPATDDTLTLFWRGAGDSTFRENGWMTRSGS